jgi:hypothetical protein
VSIDAIGFGGLLFREQSSLRCVCVEQSATTEDEIEGCETVDIYDFSGFTQWIPKRGNGREATSHVIVNEPIEPL